jgi:beta-glucanase (GH16 family)
MLTLSHLLRRPPQGTSLLLLLLLGTACTENKTPNIPAPVVMPAAVNADARDYDQYTEMVWSDEFNGAGPVDASKWIYETGNNNGWGNNELENYTTSTNNVLQNGENLIIQAQKSGNSYTSGRILTKGKQNFQFGRIDVRAKLPKGKGLWPAIWMLGSDIDQNNWPNCGEIDIMEAMGQNSNRFLSTMHFADVSGSHAQDGTSWVDLANDNFHTYSVVRSKDQMRFFLDGKQYYSFTPANTGSKNYPFNNNFFVILNLAVGGNFLGPNGSGNPDGSTVFPQQMQVDYVRYYQYKQ